MYIFICPDNSRGLQIICGIEFFTLSIELNLFYLEFSNIFLVNMVILFYFVVIFNTTKKPNPISLEYPSGDNDIYR